MTIFTSSSHHHPFRASSMAAILAAAGAPGHRSSLPNARFMVREWCTAHVTKPRVMHMSFWAGCAWIWVVHVMKRAHVKHGPYRHACNWIMTWFTCGGRRDWNGHGWLSISHYCYHVGIGAWSIDQCVKKEDHGCQIIRDGEWSYERSVTANPPEAHRSWWRMLQICPSNSIIWHEIAWIDCTTT